MIKIMRSLSLLLSITFFMTTQCAILQPPDFTDYYTTLSLDKQFIEKVDAAILNKNLKQALTELEKNLGTDAVASIQESLLSYNLKQWDEAAKRLLIETDGNYQLSLNKKKYIYKEIEKQTIYKIESFIARSYQKIALKWHSDKLKNKSEAEQQLGQNVFPKLTQASMLRNYDFRRRYSQRLKKVDDWGGHDQVIEDSKSYQERQETIREAKDPNAVALNKKEKEISDLFDVKDSSDNAYKNFIESLIQGIQRLPQYFESEAQQDLGNEIEKFFLHTIGVIKTENDFDYTGVKVEENNKFFKTFFKINHINNQNDFNNWLASSKKPDDLKSIFKALYEIFNVHASGPSLFERIKSLQDVLVQLQTKLNKLSERINDLTSNLKTG